MARTDLDPLLGERFIEGLEKRKSHLEDRQWKLLIIQFPLFLFLAFSLLNISAHISVLGISAEASKNLREVLLLVSTTFGLMSTFNNDELARVKELIRGVIEKKSGDNTELKEFLETRYGLVSFVSFLSFDAELKFGLVQWIFTGLLALCAVAVVCMAYTVVLAVQVLNLAEVYFHPNFSRNASLFVAVFVIAGDGLAFSCIALRSWFQPYQTLVDFNKLVKLQDADEQKFKKIIQEIVREHYSRGAIRRLLGRPKMKKLP